MVLSNEEDARRMMGKACFIGKKTKEKEKEKEEEGEAEEKEEKRAAHTLVFVGLHSAAPPIVSLPPLPSPPPPLPPLDDAKMEDTKIEEKEVDVIGHGDDKMDL